MPKGYWLPQIDVHDPEGYKTYIAATPPAHHKFNGVALVRGGKSEVVEGRARSRNVIREFPDYATALACYRSPEYQSAKPLRLRYAQSDFLIVEGFDDPRPAAAQSAGAKGYWIAQIDVTEPKAYGVYSEALPALAEKFAARFLVRGGAREVVEGKARARTVVVEFPSYDTALASYRSPEYQAVKRLRDGAADVDIVVIEGYDGPKF